MTLEEIEAKINAAGSDNRQYFGAEWTGGYYIQQDPKEFAELVQLLQGFEFQNYLAIGIAAGGTERFICENVKVENLYWVDDGKHPSHMWAEKNIIEIHARFKSTVAKFLGDSHHPSLPKFLGIQCKKFGKFDLVGVDGDHSPQGVLQDWEMVQPFLAPGALVWFHDIRIADPGQNGARKLWARLKTQHEVLLETSGKFGIGVIRVV